MPGFRDRFSRTDFFRIGYDDTFNTIIGAARASGPSAAIVSPGPQTLIDTVPGNTSATATLAADAAWSQLDRAPAGISGVPGNYQPVESAWYIPGPTALIDVYTPNASTTGTLVVDDPNHVIAACDTPGDNDWFAVTLTAGVTYQFGQYARAGGLPGRWVGPHHGTEPQARGPPGEGSPVTGGRQGRVTCSIPRHISSVVPSPQTT